MGMSFLALRDRCLAIGALILAMAVQPVMADMWSPVLAWRCDTEAKHMAIYDVWVDANEEWPQTRDGFYVPMQDIRDDERAVVPAFSCDLGEAGHFEVLRTELNIPKPRGMCGAQYHSQYQLLKDGELRVIFSIGCFGGVFVEAHQNGGQICALKDTDGACQRLSADKLIKLNLFGKFEERQQ